MGWLFLLFPHIIDIGAAVVSWVFLAIPVTATHEEILAMTVHTEFFADVVMPLGFAPGRYSENNDGLDFANWDFWFIWNNGTLIFTVIGLIWFIYYIAVMIVASVEDDQGKYEYKTAIIAGAWNPAIWTVFNFFYFCFSIAKIGLVLWVTELFAPHSDAVMASEWVTSECTPLTQLNVSLWKSKDGLKL